MIEYYVFHLYKSWRMPSSHLLIINTLIDMPLSLKIPDSPIERHAFHSRSFRRIIFTAGSLFLFLATIHSIASKNAVHREHSFNEYRMFHRTDSSHNSLLHQKPVPEEQISFDLPIDKIGNHPFDIKKFMKSLPEVIRIPFEEAVSDVDLEGWEDDWFSSAEYDYENKFTEPKLDFVYNCEYTKYLSLAVASTDYYW